MDQPAERAGDAMLQRVFVRDEEEMEALSAYAAASGPEILIVRGEEGCGKSALLANWAKEWAALHPDDVMILYFGFESQGSAPLASIARRLSGDVIRAQWPGTEGLNLRGSEAEVAARLSAFLAAGASSSAARVVLALDGLDALREDSATAVRDLAWLPPAAGPRLRILVSSGPRGPVLDAAMARPHTAREVAPLSEARRRAAAEAALRERGRPLPDACLERVARAEACRRPLFLAVLLDELSRAPAEAHLEAEVDALLGCGGAPRDLFRAVLRRLAARHGASLVREAASAVACARRGMAEDELKALVGVDNIGGPEPEEWDRFWGEFRPLLASGGGLFAFAHRSAGEAAELDLGAFFARRPASQRRAEEAPWALARGGPGSAERLADVLCRPDVLRHLDEAEAARLWLASGRPAEAAGRLAAALHKGSDEADPADLRRAGVLLDAMGRAGEGIPFLQEALRLQTKLRGPEHADAAAAALSLANLRMATGDFAGARPLYEESLRVRRKTLEPGHPEVGLALENLATLLKAQGDFKAARPLLEEAQQLYKKALGPEHSNVARAMQKMANLHEAQGDYAAARPLYEEALRLQRKAGGAELPEVASAMQDLALLLYATGDAAAARPMLEEALRVQKKAHGAEHPQVAKTMQNLASMRIGAGDYAAAQPLLEEALRLLKKSMGPEHPDVTGTMQNLALALKAQGKLAAARPLYEEALRVQKKTLGPEHPQQATTLQNLALLLQDQGDAAGARTMLEESLRLRKKALGADHLDVANTTQRLAQLLHAQGKLSSARPLYEEALRVFKKALGPEHPDVGRMMQNLAGLLYAQKDYAAARPVLEEALRLLKKALGPAHADVATTLEALAALLLEQRDVPAARAAYQEMLGLKRAALGAEHAAVAAYTLNLANLTHAQGDTAAARPLLEEALRLLRRAHGAEHPNVLAAMQNLSVVMRAQGEADAARALMEEVTRLRAKAAGPR
eukprot:tig00020876_g14848.t1